MDTYMYRGIEREGERERGRSLSLCLPLSSCVYITICRRCTKTVTKIMFCLEKRIVLQDTNTPYASRVTRCACSRLERRPSYSTTQRSEYSRIIRTYTSAQPRFPLERGNGVMWYLCAESRGSGSIRLGLIWQERCTSQGYMIKLLNMVRAQPMQEHSERPKTEYITERLH